ncbi:hypothetical protein [Rhabdaerophilum sp. SD176]|uniref:hypothetical protein n=1 Tax=Rhabdaerophilum sp. SD176 TaxID=2983548 RepID=UPI0024DF4871|nr:hypothetical protein [Rhabdaerophilum sp. SD176]
MDIGQLTNIDARLAWPNEARNFTPWLAENLPQLGQVIGLPLELKATEVAVESFSADILARSLIDDSLVLIENQLETTDHRHLGQILTYLAGLEAKTVIWIATEFREPHISAIKWLNEHTSDAFSFFAVRLRVVRIGDSPAAPIFEVLERPSLWERQLQATARKTETSSEVVEFRRAFWLEYLARHPQAEALGMGAVGVSSNWLKADATGEIMISVWVGQRMLGLFVRSRRGADGTETRALLEPHREALETRLGARFGGDRENTFLGRQKNVDLTDRANWPDAIDWLHGSVTQYLDVLRQILPETTP